MEQERGSVAVWARCVASAVLASCVLACGSSDGNGGAGSAGVGGAAGMAVAGMIGGVSGMSGGVGGAGGQAGTMVPVAGAAGMTGGAGGMTGGAGGMTGGAGGMTGGAGGMTGGAGGMGGPGDQPFPRSAEAVDVAIEGPYAWATFTMMNDEWNSASMYYPMDAPTPYPAMAVAPGYTESKEQMTWWGHMLASHGYAVLILTPKDTWGDQPPARGIDLVTAVGAIKAENELASSPLFGKIAIDRIALSGHSMGGGGSLHAAATLGDEVRAVIPLMEHAPAFDAAQQGMVKAAALLLAGEADTAILGPPALYSIPHYRGVTNATARAIGIIKGGDHFMAVNNGMHQDVITRYSVAWLKVYVEDDDRYLPYLYGDQHTPADFSDYCTDNADGPANTAMCQ